MIFISAGHNPRGTRPDPGAVSNGVREADLACELRDLVRKELENLGAPCRCDEDHERLAEYLSRIQTGNGSVVCEIHFNAAGAAAATGTETIVPARHTTHEWDMAKELSKAVSRHTGLKLRGRDGVITEAQSQHGSLALMREEGINALMEICFITNKNDLASYRRAIPAIAKDVAGILKKYDSVVV